MAAPRIQPTRNILPVTLREDERQAKLGKQTENDDIGTRMNGTRPESLGKRQKRGHITGTEIDTILNTQYMEWGQPTNFPGAVAPFACNKEQVTKEAKQYINRPNDPSLWTYRSRLDIGKTGASIA